MKTQPSWYHRFAVPVGRELVCPDCKRDNMFFFIPLKTCFFDFLERLVMTRAEPL